MPHIALVPEDPYFPTEHLTLVWMGPLGLSHRQLTSASELIHLLNYYITRCRNDGDLPPVNFEVFRSEDMPYSLFNGIMVAEGKVSDCLRDYRKMAERTELNGSEYSWRPHISGMQAGGTSGWRKPGEVVNFSHAEIRGN